MPVISTPEVDETAVGDATGAGDRPALGKERILWEGPGWAVPQMRRFMEVGRDWKAVEEFQRRMVEGKAALDELGIPGPPPQFRAMQPSQSLPARDATAPSHAGPKRKRQAGASGNAAAGVAARSGAGGAAEGGAGSGAAGQPGCGVGDQSAPVRRHFQMVLAYHGAAFEGWAVQPGKPQTVQGCVGVALAAAAGADRPVHVECSGRTDKGVSALAQVTSFSAWGASAAGPADAFMRRLRGAVDAAAPGRMRVVHMEEAPRSFHATFLGTWRRYVYLFPLRTGADWAALRAGVAAADDAVSVGPYANLDMAIPDTLDVTAQRVDRLLRPLEGRPLNFSAYARDTPKGKDCTCTLITARATGVQLPRAAAPHRDADSDRSGRGGGVPCIAVELVAARFLRKMVRVLVASALQEVLAPASRLPAAAGAAAETAGCAVEPGDALVRLAEAGSRTLTAPPAPAGGLVFVGAGYEGVVPPP